MIKGLLLLSMVCFLPPERPHTAVTLCGEYEVKPRSFFNKYSPFRKHYDGRMLGCHLTLRPDSGFIYTTCGNISEGCWKSDKDEVLLYVSSSRFRVAKREEKEKPVIPAEPLRFRRKGRMLYREFTEPDGSEIVEELTKTATSNQH